MNEKMYRLAMHSLTSLAPVQLYRLLNAAGSAEELFRMKPEDLYGLGISISLLTVQEFAELQKDGVIERKWQEMQENGIRYISFEDADFPERLKSIDDPPFGLFVRGRLPEAERPAAAIVGARNCSVYGKEYAHFFGKKLAEAGVSVISGMALGIDGQAERGALSTGQPSYAVLGGGVDVCYPREHVGLYRQLILEGGIISERPPGYTAKNYDFPIRNRLISGLSDVLLVIEASEHSGTSITVNCALKQNREVFALPGRVSDRMSSGCNKLIQNGAQVLLCPEDVLQYLGLNTAGESRKKGRALLSKEEELVYGRIRTEPAEVEDLIEETGLPAGSLMSVLLSLELKGLVRKEALSGYVRIL